MFSIPVRRVRDVRRHAGLALRDGIDGQRIRPGIISLTADILVGKLVSYYTMIIQGLFSGIIAGIMGEGRIASGLERSIIMMLIGYVARVILI